MQFYVWYMSNEQSICHFSPLKWKKNFYHWSESVKINKMLQLMFIIHECVVYKDEPVCARTRQTNFNKKSGKTKK